MNSEQKNSLKNKLMKEISDKQATIKSGKEELLSLQHSAPDPVDESSANERQEFIVKQNQRLSLEISTLRQALKNLNSPDFGYCEDCGIDIPHERLEARPSASTCVECETIREKVNKHRKAA